MFTFTTTTNTNNQNLDAVTALMHTIMRRIAKVHPELTVITDAVVHKMNLNRDFDVFDETPVVRYLVKDRYGNTVFDILPLLNAHDYDEDGDIWCIEGFFHDEDDIMYWLEDEDPFDIFEEINSHL